jgi:hypothetical protein
MRRRKVVDRSTTSSPPGAARAPAERWSVRAAHEIVADFHDAQTVGRHALLDRLRAD